MTTRAAKAESLTPPSPQEVANFTGTILAWIDVIDRSGVTSYTVAVPHRIKITVAEALREKRYRVQLLQNGLNVNWS